MVDGEGEGWGGDLCIKLSKFMKWKDMFFSKVQTNTALCIVIEK